MARNYPILGGPLDGMTACGFKDFDQEHYALEPYPDPATQMTHWRFNKNVVTRVAGPFADLADDYTAYNRNGRTNTAPKMIFVHKSLLP
jgi:hypothetical protein